MCMMALSVGKSSSRTVPVEVWRRSRSSKAGQGWVKCDMIEVYVVVLEEELGIIVSTRPSATQLGSDQR